MDEIIDTIMEVNMVMTLAQFQELGEMGFTFEIQDGFITRAFRPGEVS